MKPSDQIIQVLDYLGQKIGVTIDWTSANVMPYLQELFRRFVTWEISTSVACIIIAILAIIIAIIVLTNLNWFEEFFEDADCAVFMFIVALAIIGTAIAAIIYQAFDIIECLTIPEKTLYEYISIKILKTTR